MSNPLTGDYPASFQLSGGTLNRLLASMHANDWQDDWTPSFPHSVEMRLDEGGVRGGVEAQVGVPQLELRHGSTDRFGLRVGIRALYRPDPGTERLAEFIHGTVSADYVFGAPDPSWPGWSEVAAQEYVAVRPVEGSVRFDGTLEGGDADSDPARVLLLVTDQLAHLLRTRFGATPQRVGSRFRPGTVRALATGTPAVTGPIEVEGAGGGQIASLEHEWLEGWDVGVAVARDFVMSALEPLLAQIRDFRVSIPVEAGPVSTVYRVAIASATATWSGAGSAGAVDLRVEGSATTDSIGADATFSVDQRVDMRFDAGTRSLVLAAGTRTVSASADGLLAGEVASLVKSNVDRQFGGLVGPALSSAAPTLNRFLAGADELGAQVRRFDRHATLRFEDGSFGPDALVVRGRIEVNPLAKPAIRFGRTPDRGAFTALTSWVPGGEITGYHWKWVYPPGTMLVLPSAQKADASDNYFLRPYRMIMSEEEGEGGLVVLGPPRYLTEQIPGLEGDGGVTLSVDAVRVNRAGALEAIEVDAFFIGFNYRFPFELPPWVHDNYWIPWDMRGEDIDPRELSREALRRAIQEVDEWAYNTLVVSQGGGVTAETLETVREVLTTHRLKAGLLTVTALAEGESALVERGVADGLVRLARESTVPLVVAELVGSGLGDALALPRETSEPAFRLISPRGGVTWRHDGPLSAADLGAALDGGMMPSPNPVAEALSAGPAPGDQLWKALDGGVVAGAAEGYPAPPLGRHGDGPAVALFVDARSAASLEQLRNVEERRGRGEGASPRITVVVDGDLDAVRALGSKLGRAVDAIPDPDGAIAARAGVDGWPTTVMLDERGVVLESWTGADTAPLDATDFGRREVR